jgi:hypothetical protein
VRAIGEIFVRRAEDCQPYLNPRRRVKPLEEIYVKQRRWTLDVLNIVRRISLTRPRGHPLPSDGRRIKGEGVFTNEDVYAFAGELEKLHPDNRHVRDKIRQ